MGAAPSVPAPAAVQGAAAPHATAADGLPPADALPRVAGVATPNGIRIVALRCGWVGVKRTHRELDVPAPLAIPAIMLGWAWAAWMPVWAFAVTHPTGGPGGSPTTVLVDTGPAPDINDATYFAADPSQEFFYRRNLRFHLPDGGGDTLVPRLAAAGLAPADVRTLVVTHFHADHVGCVGAVAHARALTGAGNWPTHLGAFTARLPAGWAPESVAFPSPTPPTPPAPPAPGAAAAPAEAALDALFPATRHLTPDGALRLVPLPGHTPGHVGLAVVDAGRVWLAAGDATFDDDQTHRCGVCGVSTDVAAARDTQRRLRELLARGGSGVTLLPAHDPAVPARLAASGRVDCSSVILGGGATGTD